MPRTLLSSLGTLVAFRQRLIEGHMDRRLIERTIEIANQSQVFGSRAERPALDRSPLWGAGRVEDTYNPPLTCAEKGHARGGRSSLGGSWSKLPAQAQAHIVCATSVKAALDQDWDQVTNRQKALSLIVQVLDAVDDSASGRGGSRSAVFEDCSSLLSRKISKRTRTGRSV